MEDTSITVHPSLAFLFYKRDLLPMLPIAPNAHNLTIEHLQLKNSDQGATTSTLILSGSSN